MAEYFTHDLINGILFFQVVILAIILSNTWILHRSRRHPATSLFPMVSILVPARNEERNIARCIHSLLAMDYPAFEVLVLDDQSNDNTRLILDKIAASQPQLRVVDGAPPPGNQLGKNWACSQLAQLAQGELLFFTDADTFHRPGTLRSMVTVLMGEGADMITGYPRQEVPLWGERLLVPFFSWAMYCFNPLFLAYRLRLPYLSGAVGQMMLFRQGTYMAVGGHEGVSSVIVDDLALARQIKSAGFRWRVTYIADLISCRMYHGYSEAFNGFCKNLFAAFDFRLLPFAFVFIWLGFVFCLPLFVLFLVGLGHAPLANVNTLLLSVGLSILIWSIPYFDTGIPFGLAFLYPLTILANEWVAFQSVRKTISGRLSWKGRAISGPRWRWL